MDASRPITASDLADSQECIGRDDAECVEEVRRWQLVDPISTSMSGRGTYWSGCARGASRVSGRSGHLGSRRMNQFGVERSRISSTTSKPWLM